MTEAKTFRPGRWLATLAVAILAAGVTRAGGTQFFDVADFGRVEKIDLQGVALTVDGGVVPAPLRRALAGPVIPVLWDVIPAPDGGALAVGGAPGALLHLPLKGEGRKLLEVEEAELTALARLADGTLVVGVSPGGEILAVEPDGASRSLFGTGSRYVWDLLVDGEGSLWVATGSPGAVHRLRAGSRTAERLVDLGEEQARCLAPAADGRVLVGTSGEGRILLVDGEGRRSMLHDADLPEVAALRVASDGAVLAALVAGDAGGVPGQPFAGSAPGESPARAGTAATPGAPNGGGNGRPVPAPEGAGRGRVVRIAANGAVTSLWWSDTEVALGILEVPGDGTWIGVSPGGGIVRIEEPGRWARLAELPARSVTALESLADGRVLAITGGLGTVSLLDPAEMMDGLLVSSVHDAGPGALFGRAEWWLRSGGSPSVELSFRSGRTAEPDGTWSRWSAWAGGGFADAPVAPVGRFLQWRARLRPTSGEPQPELERVRVAYLPQNRPPRLAKSEVLPSGVTLEPLPAPAGQGGPPPGSAAAASLMGNAGMTASPMPRTRRVWIDGRRTVVWEVSDPEGDPLVARVLLRADGEKEFLPFADEITRSFFVFDEGELSDGGYTFRIEIDDSPGNTSGRTGRDTAETPRFVVDRIPPTVEDLVWQARQGRWEFTFAVEDGLGPPRDVQVAVDGEPFVGALPEDGVEDEKRESYRVVRPAGAPGLHVVVVRGHDGSGNVSSVRLRFEAQR
jgi:hypothetical protein